VGPPLRARTNDRRAARLDRNEAVNGLEDDPVNDEEILAVEAAAARLESSASPSGDYAAASLQSAVAAAVTKGKSIRDVAMAAQLTVLEVLDAADAVTYRGHAL
jgi:hypothetical protein